MHRFMSEVTNDSRSSSDHQTVNDEGDSVRKRRLCRVRSSAKSPTDGMPSDTSPESSFIPANVKQHSPGLTTDKRPFPFGQCRVCADKATGAHYGVPTCEGCKGFFKRSILRKEKYRCYFGDGCIITTDNRNRCKSCRFRKCLREGMSVEGVRMGRIPKLVKERALAEHHLSTSSLENEDPTGSFASSLSPYLQSVTSSSDHFGLGDFELELVDEQSILDEFDLLAVNRSPSSYVPSDKDASLAHFAFDETSARLDDSPNALSRSMVENGALHQEMQYANNVLQRIGSLVTTLSQPTASIELDHENSSFIRYLRWKMIDLAKTHNACTQQLVERMSGLIRSKTTDFPGDRSSLHDIWAGLTDAIPFHVKNLINFAREMPAVNELDPKDFHRIMNNRLFDFWLIKHAPLIRHGESYIMLPNGLQYTRKWMNRIIGEETVQAIFAFAQKFNALNLTHEDYALIFPVVICTKDDTLSARETVRHIQYCYLYALYTQMLTTRSQTEARAVFRNLLQLFTLLPSLNELQEKKIGALTPDMMDFES